jgi:hypothetical protein
MTINIETGTFKFLWEPPSEPTTEAVSFSLVSSFSASNPVVTIVTANSVTQMSYGLHYTITSQEPDSFNINFLQRALSDFTVAGTVEIKRDTPETQDLDMVEGGALNLENFELALDKLTVQVQDLKGKSEACISVPTYDLSSDTLPSLARTTERYDKYLKFDNSGNPICVSSVTHTGTINVGTVGKVIVESNTSEVARTASESAKLTGDISNTFLVAAPVADGDATNRAYVLSQINDLPSISFRSINLITNSYLMINQRGEQNYSTNIQSVETFMFDRWKYYKTTSKKIKISRVSNITRKSYNIFEITPESITKPSSGKYIIMSQAIEEKLTNPLKTYSYITIGFWLKYTETTSSATTLVSGSELTSKLLYVSVQDAGKASTASNSFSVSVVNTWEFKAFKVKISGAERSIVLSNDSGKQGLNLNLCLSSGEMAGMPDMKWHDTATTSVSGNNQFWFTDAGQKISISNIFVTPGDNTFVDGTMIPHETPAAQEEECKRFLQIAVPQLDYGRTSGIFGCTVLCSHRLLPYLANDIITISNKSNPFGIKVHYLAIGDVSENVLYELSVKFNEGIQSKTEQIVTFVITFPSVPVPPWPPVVPLVYTRGAIAFCSWTNTPVLISCEI